MLRIAVSLLAALIGTAATATAQEIPKTVPATGRAGALSGPVSDSFQPEPLRFTRHAGEVLSRVQEDAPITTRGAREVQLFRVASPSVVLVLTEDGLGSGSLLDANTVLTNHHVVGDEPEVGVIFKPVVEGKALTTAGMVKAKVIRIDEIADLALLRLAAPPPAHVKPIALGDKDEIQVGADVHAIGHPTGEAWTYTKGIISQVRSAYEWEAEDGIHHKADVIQTQTPINPGNSGGPLLSDAGNLIGVNAFKAEGEGLNFAVAVGEVRRFLALKMSRLAPDAGKRKAKTEECKAKMLFEGRSKENDGDLRVGDTDCDGTQDIVWFRPDDKTEPISLMIDTNGDGEPDIMVLDKDRDGKWDISYHDIDFDGKPDLVGYHDDGDVKPSRLAQYKKE